MFFLPHAFCALSLLLTIQAADWKYDDYPDYSYAVEEAPVTTDISCWMGNTRISPRCSLERCDFWITYNSTRVVKGSACISAEYSVDGENYLYRNCSYTVSSLHDPCEQLILGASNPRVDILSCELCWDNGCNYYKRKTRTSNLLWYLLGALGICLIALIMVCAVKHCTKSFYSC